MYTVNNMGSGRISLQTGPEEKGGQNKAFVCSVGMHVVVFMLAFVVMRAPIQEKKTLIIDFSLGDRTEVVQPVSRRVTKSVAAEVHRPSSVKTTRQHALTAKDVGIQPEPQVQQVTGPADHIAAAAQVTPLSSVPASGARPPGGGGGSASSTSFSGTERPEMRYVKAHFAGIRNAIISRLSYPRLARRMGWEGTVKVSFVVNEDGGVNNVRVLMTSGFDLLDNNAIETIKRCAPYPRPPCRAEMVMPITYRLDE